MSRFPTGLLIPVFTIALAMAAVAPVGARAVRNPLSVTVDGSTAAENRSDSHQTNDNRFCEYSVRLKGVAATGTVVLPAGLTQAGVAGNDLGSLTIKGGELNFSAITTAPATCQPSLALLTN